MSDLVKDLTDAPDQGLLSVDDLHMLNMLMANGNYMDAASKTAFEKLIREQTAYMTGALNALTADAELATKMGGVNLGNVMTIAKEAQMSSKALLERQKGEARILSIAKGVNPAAVTAAKTARTAAWQ